tara:strand:+ start:2857 stop:3477 length:621 start_codon:yes stop_codon:yes gene_type:complete
MNDKSKNIEEGDGAARSHSDVIRSKDVKVIFYRDPDTGKRHKRRIHKAINVRAADQDGDGDNDVVDQFIRKRRKSMEKAIGKQKKHKKITASESTEIESEILEDISKPEMRVMRKPSIGRGPDGRPRWNSERKKTQNIKVEEKRPEILTVKKKIKLKNGTTYESNPEEAKVAPIGESCEHKKDDSCPLCSKKKKTFKEFVEDIRKK